MRTPLNAFAARKGIFLACTLGALLLLAALPAVAESGQSGYPIRIDIRATVTGDEAMPFNFAVQPNREVVLLIRNYTRELHTFAIPAIGLNVAVLPGSPRAPRTTRVSFVLPARFAVYRWFCVPCKLGLHHGHHMGGRIYTWINPTLEIGR